MILIFPLINDVEHRFIYLLIIMLEKCLFSIFVHFIIGLFVFIIKLYELLIYFQCSLQIYGLTILSSIDCLFILLIIYFEVQTFFGLM